MGDYEQLIQDVENAGNEIFWLGAADEEQVTKLESTLGAVLPDSFKSFLVKYGGGGVIDAEISGIEDNDASISNGGTVLGDTVEARASYQLPSELIVVFFRDDEICWCLDVSKMNSECECPVVNYDLFKKKVTNKIAENFEVFFQQYLELRSES